MADIHVTHSHGDSYRVEVREGSSSTVHEVLCSPEHLARFGGHSSPHALLEASFRFLLEREPKESILRRFELPVIARYFPEYPEEIRRRLGAR